MPFPLPLELIAGSFWLIFMSLALCLCRGRTLSVEQRSINLYGNYPPLWFTAHRSRDSLKKAPVSLMGRTHWPWREQVCKTSAGNVSGETRASWTPGIDIRVRDLQRLSGLICLPSIDSTGSGHTILMFTVEPVFPSYRGPPTCRPGQSA